MAQFDPTGRLLTPGVVWTFTADRGLATKPQPRNHNGNVETATAQLAWQPGNYNVRQRVYFSPSREALEQATRPAAELTAQAASCPVPTQLSPGTRCYWRVDSDNDAQPASRGPVWTFRTQDAPVPNDVTFFVGSDTHYG